MRRRDKAGGKAVKTQRRKTLKRRNAPKVARPHKSPAAGDEAEVARLRRELSEALEQQTATSEVLRAISGSPTDAVSTLEAIAESVTRLLDVSDAEIMRVEGDVLKSAAKYGPSTQWPLGTTRPLSRDWVTGRAVIDRAFVHVADLQTSEREFPQGAAYARQYGHRTTLAVPLLREGFAIGAILIRRLEVRPFTDKQITLAQNFAAQAVIAIENSRLLSELRESLQQQTATSDVLEVISRSAFDLQPIFETVAESAVKLCGADRAFIFRFDGEMLRSVVAYNAPSALEEFIRNNPIRPDRSSAAGRAAYERRTVHIPDVKLDPEYTFKSIDAAPLRTILAVPILKDAELLGVILTYSLEVRPFTDKQIALVETFADQAAIAIENVRLFEAEQQRTAELTELLEQQTATSKVLEVISRSAFDLKAIFEAVIESAARLCEALSASLYLREGDVVVPYAHSGPLGRQPIGRQLPLNLDRVTSRAILEARNIQVPDLRTSDEYPQGKEDAIRYGHRTTLAVPLLREGAAIGAILVRRREVRPFTEKQIELVSNFAAQAVIAIENTRLLNELRELLQQQTATADVLKVISRSAFDLRPVLDTLVESAARLCDADRAIIFKRDDAVYRLAAGYKTSREFEEFTSQNPIVPGRGTITGRAVLEGKTVHIPDVLADPEYTGTGYQTRGEYRSSLAVPLLREGETIGVFTLMRLAVRPYTEKQIELVTTFADQAVIAIENVRLFEEVQARTSELAQSVKELRALGEVTQSVNSSVDLETVLTTIVAKATQLSNTEAGAIYVFDDANQEFRLRATYGMDERIIAEIRDRHMHIGETAIGKAAEQRMPVQIADIQNDPSSPVLDVIVRAGFRALLVVPLLGADRIVGALVVRRKQPGEFPKSTVELLQTFAAQSVLAIQNARLFESVEARTRELAKSLEDLRTAQDRLVQTEKLASLGQLTAGIAHEIKNPLNFVNNFSAISVELIDELREALAGANLDDKLRAQISEIADMLQGNLDKVVQHGKRADSIVKNMLLHSRQGSQEHRPVDINAIVEESLNLAYHGARAEKQGFNITLERSFDPTAGEVDVFPQDITRVLLNLISNGFYAATKRKAEANGGDYEPTLAAATKNLGDSVEIRIRDNGTGIPPEVKEKIFNPFFTTKPAGEGTGLGLSISHDIIVKQHGGSIEVDTQPGEFTEFRIVLPRGAATIAKSGERA